MDDRGHDLLDWFRGHRPWAQLKRFVDRLPAHSRYGAALLEDPEVAEQMAVLDDGDTADMTMAGFDPYRSLLSALIDAVNQNTVAVIAVAGGDPPEFAPAPRPVTGLEKARLRVRHQAREAFADALLGISPH